MSSAALSASLLLPLLKLFSPDDLGFLDLICTVALVVVVWRDWREPPEVSPGLRTHIANIVNGGGEREREDNGSCNSVSAKISLATNLDNDNFSSTFPMNYS